MRRYLLPNIARHLTVVGSLAVPQMILAIHRLGSRAEVEERVSYLLQIVGLRPEQRRRFPHEFSGGQRQRIGIARALALSPRLIVADEPVSGLDVSVRGQVLNLMTVLQERFDLTYPFVSYDLGVVEHLADRVAVIYLGHVVELGEVPDVYGRPLHPYTEALPSAIPTPDPDVRPHRIVLQGSVPSPANPSPGCPFQTRCPYVQERCRHEPPPLRASAPGHLIACHRSAELHLAGVESSPAGSGKEQGRLQSIGPLAQNPPLMPERSLNQNE